MYKRSRYHVSGFENGVFISTVYKEFNSAVRFAESLLQGEVFDFVLKTVVYQQGVENVQSNFVYRTRSNSEKRL